jgi:stage V sporulation protein AC
MDDYQRRTSACVGRVLAERRKFKNEESGGTAENGMETGSFDEEMTAQGLGITRQTGHKSGETEKERYNAYVKEVTPAKNLWWQMLKAFITGGIICVIGQGILNYCENIGLDKETSGSWSSLLLVLLSVLLTGLSLYQYIAAWGGAGALVPITGFANSVASPAIEYKAEGQVYGIGVKIFTIAGPVILYGIFTSWVLGLFYWIGKLMGWT